VRIVGLLPLAAALTVASPFLAGSQAYAAAEKVQSAQSQDEDPLAPFWEKFYAGDYKAALKIASEFEFVDTKEGRALKQALRATALLGLGKAEESRKLFAEADRAWPTEPLLTVLQFEAAVRTEQVGMIYSSFDTMIARFPDKVREMPDKTVWYLLREQPKGQERRNEDRRIALARLGYGGSEGDYLSVDAVRILLKRGDIAGATELIQYIDDPQAIENMLVQKRYSALWPKIEAVAGPGLSKVRASSVAAAEQAHKESPDDLERLQYLINARRHAGRIDEAIALKAKLPVTADALAKADEQVGWGINNVALALHEAGRADDADALFEQLNTAKIEKDVWRVSMIINRVELLVADGKFAKAAQLLPLTESVTATNGSPYAKQLVRRLKYCTLSGLGRKEEAAKLVPDMMTHAKDAYHATVDGLLCAGELERAEKLVLEALSNEDFEEQFVRAVQPTQLTSDDPSMWQDRWQVLRQRPAISKEFERIGRDMPRDFLPTETPV
jgi:tetratricopeptide (TPR) repeat protein